MSLMEQRQTVEERNLELEDPSLETSKTKKRTKTEKHRIEYPSTMGQLQKRCNIRVMGLPKEERENGTEAICEGTITRNFYKLMSTPNYRSESSEHKVV